MYHNLCKANIGLFQFLEMFFMDPSICFGPYIREYRTWPMSSHLDLTLDWSASTMSCIVFQKASNTATKTLTNFKTRGERKMWPGFDSGR